jgi:hypothetical protein
MTFKINLPSEGHEPDDDGSDWCRFRTCRDLQNMNYYLRVLLFGFE